MYTGLFANLAIAVLAGFVGVSVVTRIAASRRESLLAGATVVHGVVVVAAVVVLGSMPSDAGWGARIVAFAALIFGTVNVVGGLAAPAEASSLPEPVEGSEPELSLPELAEGSEPELKETDA
ncbi:MAG: proton-translocating transhydrogenase family protein [Gordonia sp. (in: high G+C Gram-positive bacteria)]